MGDRDEEDQQSNGATGETDSGRDENERNDSSGQGRDGADQSGQDGQEQDGQGQGGDGQSGRQQPSTAETATMVVSVGFALCLLAFAGWQIATPVAATAPEASVVDAETLQNGDVAVTVELRNPGGAGLVSATVESNCTAPPADVGFDYVPASSARQGTVVCPAGTVDPSVSVANWVTV